MLISEGESTPRDGGESVEPSRAPAPGPRHSPFSLLVVGLVGLFFGAVLTFSGCGEVARFHHGDYWVKVAEPCNSYRWVQVTGVNAQEFFGLRLPGVAGRPGKLVMLAGTVRPESPKAGACIVYSVVDELTAMRLTGPTSVPDPQGGEPFILKDMEGWSIWDHEIRGHVWTGDNHPEGAR